MTLFMFGVLALGLASPVLGQTDHDGNPCQKRVGSCIIRGCSEDRGPTECSWGACMCQAGFCALEAPRDIDKPWESAIVENYCLQRIPDITCQYASDCNTAGAKCVGAHDNVLVKDRGLCVCERNAVFDGTKCVPDPAVLLTAGNSTVDLAFLHQQKHAGAFNVFMFGAWGLGLVAAITAGAALAYRKFRSQEEGDYIALICE